MKIFKTNQNESKTNDLNSKENHNKKQNTKQNMNGRSNQGFFEKEMEIYIQNRARKSHFRCMKQFILPVVQWKYNANRKKITKTKV